MTEDATIYQMVRLLHDETKLPVFPVRISEDENGKWQKQPLVKWGSISGNPNDVVWRDANAIGVPMGHRSGLITIDLDDYKEGAEVNQWLQKHKVPKTLTHQTASGGRHLIFRLPLGLDLGNKAPPVTGLDIRGNGGFIVWADLEGHYSVLDHTEPALLPDGICAELLALQTAGAPTLSDAALPPFGYVRQDALDRKLDRLLAHPDGALVRARFEGSTDGLSDKSASGRDMSVAALLARRGLGYDEIVQTLQTRFPYGVAARDGEDTRTERLAKRCAFRAIEEVQRRSDQRRQAMKKKLAELHGQFRPKKPTTQGEIQ